MSNTNESILRRARALNAMAKQAGSENEAMIAAEKLAAYLLQVNLDESLLEDDHPVALISKKISAKYNETWRRSVYGSAAELFMCNYFYEETYQRSAPINHVLIGEEHNVAVATEMGEYFEATVNRLANEASRLNKDVTSDHTSRHRLIRSFRLAAAQRLRSRVYEYTRAARRGQLKVTDDTGNELRLPALQTLYERQEQLYQAYLKAHGIIFEAASVARDKQLSDLGVQLGRQAGDSISFTTQVGSGSRGHALPKPS
jgi:hypothetical protein